MKKLKYEILFTILFMTVGIAAVSSNVFLSGSTQLVSNSEDFNVYFSDVLVDGEQNLSLVQNETGLVFNGEFSAVGDKKEITYDVTNASKNYDADIDITCTQSTEYLTISNSFDTDSYLSARSTRSGVLTIILSKSYTGADLKQDISCTINASAVERNSQGSGNVGLPLSKSAVGAEVSIGEEKFNIISDNGDTVTLLAQYNLGTDYRQSSAQNGAKFANTNGWEYKPGPKEIDIQTWTTNPKTYVNAYVEYLKEELGDDTVTGDLITLKDLEALGCTVPSDYASGSGGWNCYDSPYGWLANGQDWWTCSASSTYSNHVWNVLNDGRLNYYGYHSNIGVRPTITISKELCDDLLNNIIFFTIDDVVYKAKSGMTWGEWVDSEYNPGIFESYYENVRCQTVLVLDPDGNTVHVNDLIVAGAVYSLSNIHSGGYVD